MKKIGGKMDVLVAIIFYGALTALAVATFVLLSAAELLKQYAQKDSEAYIARYHSKTIAAAAVILGVISYYIAESSEDAVLAALVPCAIVFVAGMLNASWWLLHRATVVEYTEQHQYEKRMAQQKKHNLPS